ncbi:MAG: Asp-tRNA(Asn)/Glu-tRNA(Gln) amidotransferase subunit GatC [Pirellulales bacterium]|nr:Asp-tRNA(Asn)/Glu-tRNA(Gln) amidotransferase subunit GatC [Pirellulales bacterium]
MSISRDEVEKVALLARLALAPDELTTMTAEMAKILGYMDLLREVDTEHVEPMAHALDVADVFRDDEVRPSLTRDDALANAPARDEECYRVPAVLGDGS